MKINPDIVKDSKNDTKSIYERNLLVVLVCIT